jgi:ankyrin repeat protein
VLLENGADPDFKDVYYRAPLLHASIRGHKAILELLLNNRVSINAKDWNGTTALYEAIVSLLLERGTYIKMKENCGGTPLAWAIDNGLRRLSSYFSRWMPM